MEQEKRQCNECGETWWDTGDLICPYCDSDDTEIVDSQAAKEAMKGHDWGQ